MTAVVEDLVRVAVRLGLPAHHLKSVEAARERVVIEAGLDAAGVRREQWRAVLPKVDEAAQAALRAHRESSRSRCTACDAPVWWVPTEAGRAMPLDPMPRPDGNVIRLAQGKTLAARVLPPEQLPVVGRPAYVTHFVTCPHGDLLRRRRAKKKTEATRRPCSVCGKPLHEWLSEHGYKTHPTCDPDEKGND